MRQLAGDAELLGRRDRVATADHRERPGGRGRSHRLRNYQWAFPTAWPPSTWITVAGLRRYGYETEARRVAAKYLAVADRLFAETGRLWEKTDAESGLVATGEYKAPPMIGWCAGVYVALHDYLATAS